MHQATPLSPDNSQQTGYMCSSCLRIGISIINHSLLPIDRGHIQRAPGSKGVRYAKGQAISQWEHRISKIACCKADSDLETYLRYLPTAP
jgi:hypothetical protein